MEPNVVTASVLKSMDSLLMILDDRVQECIFRSEQKQPGSIHKALLVTQGFLTGNLPLLANAPSEIMMRGPVANSLEQRINEISKLDTGVLPMVEGRLLKGSESLRGAVLTARFRFAEHSNNANSLLSTRNQLRSTHANFMNQLTGDVVADQQIRDKITHVENDLDIIDREVGRLTDEMQMEVEALRQRLDGMIHLLGGYVRLGLTSRTPIGVKENADRNKVAEVVKPQPIETSNDEWLEAISPLLEFCFKHADKSLGVSASLAAAFYEKFFGTQLGRILGSKVAIGGLRELFSSGGFINYLAVWRAAPLSVTAQTVIGLTLKPGRALEVNWVYNNLKQPFKIFDFKKYPQHLDDAIASLKKIELPNDLKKILSGKGTLKYVKKPFIFVGAIWDGVTEGRDEYSEKLDDGRSRGDARVHAAADGALVGGVSLAAGAYGAAIGTALFPGVGTAAGFIFGVGFSLAAGWASKSISDSDIYENLVDDTSKVIGAGIKWAQGFLS